MPMIFAYIDPFTGSLLLQLFAGIFMSALVFFKKIKAVTFGLLGFKMNVELIDDVETVRLDEHRKSDRDQEKKTA